MKISSVPASAGLRGWLGWLLMGTSGLSVWALWTPQALPVVEPASPRAEPARPRARAASGPIVRALRDGGLASAFEETDFDPFAGVQPPAPPPPPPPPRQPVVAAAVPPPMPVRPTLDARFAGRMVGPDGLPATYLRVGDQTLSVAAGTALPGGFVVSDVLAAEIHVRHPMDTSQTPYVVPVPVALGSDQ